MIHVKRRQKSNHRYLFTDQSNVKVNIGRISWASEATRNVENVENQSVTVHYSSLENDKL